MEDFFERIDVNASLNEIAREICSKCNMEDYLSSQIVEVGYEDFNFIIETKTQKFFVKIFHKGRTSQDCSNYIDRIKLSNKIDINTPKTICFDSIKIDDKGLKFVVFEYINGKSFLDLQEMPNETEIKEIIRQMANIHRAGLKSDFIYDTCDRVLLLSNGKLVADGLTQEILTDKKLLEDNGLELPLSFIRVLNDE